MQKYVTIVFIADRCGPVEQFDDMVADSVNVTVGSIVTYQCEKGYQFMGGANQNRLSCTNDLRWTGFLTQCEGKKKTT